MKPLPSWLLTAICLTSLSACEPNDPGDEVGWQLVHEELDGALLSVWGTSSTDVWTVGADTRDGQGPLVARYDGESWTRVESGLTEGDLWWVFGFEDGPVYMGGEGGVIVRYADGTFTTMETPSTETVFGIWGSGPDDVWAVGGTSDNTGGFAWHVEGDAWVAEPSLTQEISDSAAIWKVFGTAANDAWLVGSNGVALHWDGSTLEQRETGVGSSLFTVHERDGNYVAVGGFGTGVIVELDDSGEWINTTPDPPPMGLSGVFLGEDGTGIAVGLFGGVLLRENDAWAVEDTGLSLSNQNLHAAWIDERGDLWAVGGQTFNKPLTDGLLIHRGDARVSSEGL